ncbi:hypothetical protein BC938DRAFT_480901 [Jimgerdemannia flammicorona]|uniref:Uncharacterized protein n=1 Tax=Jimgerdemannia flammicorona TaxID=994334 RepID=A0A433QHE5_9FUNG|nr:hypothetical protein BC938DRAFT_480901 [Jimgerdemannia flammicorona]
MVEDGTRPDQKLASKWNEEHKSNSIQLFRPRFHGSSGIGTINGNILTKSLSSEKESRKRNIDNVDKDDEKETSFDEYNSSLVMEDETIEAVKASKTRMEMQQLLQRHLMSSNALKVRRIVVLQSGSLTPLLERPRHQAAGSGIRDYG